MREVALPPISDAEWEVMKVLWDRTPQTAAEVIDALASARQWNPKTVRTLLARLVTKGALGYETDGRRYLYRPRVAQDACLRAETRSFLDRVFDGSVAPMLAQLADEGALDGEDLAALRQLLDAQPKPKASKGGKR